jgi:thiosulfate/3-mercaptopyruvate sulfurtransferase
MFLSLIIIYKSRKYSTPVLNEELIRNYQQISEIVNDETSQVTIIDARPSPRFTGEAPEPRPGLSSGHMPRAKNVPFKDLFDMETGKLHTNEQLTETFKRAGVDVESLKKAGTNVVLSCGSGVSASVPYFALERLGAEHLSIYDGSWTEYASLPQSRIVKD